MHTGPASGVDAAAGRSAREVRYEEVPVDEMSADEARRDRDALLDAPEDETGERIRTAPVEDEATGMSAVSTVDRTDAKDRTGTLDLKDRADTGGADDEPTLAEQPRGTVAIPARTGFVHTSLAASTSLFLGTAGLAAAFSGPLAPVGVVLGALAVLCAGFGLVMAGRDRVTGHGVAVAGLLLGLGAVSVAALVMAGDLSWLHSTTDAVGKARAWLNDHFTWMRDW